jgi:hypothetical protein
MVTVSKNQLSKNIWQNFYQLISDNVKSVTVNGPSGGTSTIRVKKYTGSDSDITLDSSKDYPIIVINTPEIEYSALTFKKTMVTGAITIEVYVPNSEASTAFKDLINSTIQDNLSKLWDVALEELYLDDDASSSFERGSLKIHQKQVTWRFEYIFE